MLTHIAHRVVRPAKNVQARVHLAAGDQAEVADCFLVHVHLQLEELQAL